MMNISPKFIGLATAAIGGILYHGNLQRDLMIADTHYENNQAAKELEHAQEVNFDYTGNGFLTSFKHLFAPLHAHAYMRPLYYLGGFVKSLTDNLIPLALMATGLTYGFGKTYSDVFGKIGKGLTLAHNKVAPIFDAVCSHLYRAWNTAQWKGKFTRAVWDAFEKHPTPSLAATGMLAYLFYRLMGEFTGANQRDEFNGFVRQGEE
jgi:hypothetical protein